MAGAIVQFKNNGSSGPSTTLASGTLVSNVTSGNYLWITVSNNGTPSVTITKNSGTATIGTVTPHGSIQEAGTLDSLAHFTCQVTGTGTIDILATFGASQTELCIGVVEVSGVNAVDGSDEQTDSGNNPTTTCTVNVTTQPAFGLMMLANYQGAGSTNGTGWTLHSQTFWNTVIGEGVLQYKAITATGNTTGNFANAGLDRNNAVMIVFTDSGGGGGASLKGRKTLLGVGL